MNLIQGGTNLFINGIVLGTIYAGGYLVTMNQLSHGDLMAFLVAAQTIQRSLAQLTLLFGNAVRGLESGARVFQIINMQPKISISGGKTIPYHSFIAEIEFDRVFFAYPTRPEQVSGLILFLKFVSLKNYVRIFQFAYLQSFLKTN